MPKPRAGQDIPTPDLGRTARVVGPVTNVHTDQMPHQRNARGELGRAMFHWYTNTVSPDPIGRIASPLHFADKRNLVGGSVDITGVINPSRTVVSDPAAMSRHIKRVGRAFGAELVGIARNHPSFLYAGNEYVGDKDDRSVTSDRRAAMEELDRDEIVRRYPYLIVAPFPWPYELGLAHRHHIGDAAYHFANVRGKLVLQALEGYIHELGYAAIPGAANPQAAALAAGVGELGRNGMLITERYGARVILHVAIMTDLPLEPDRPVDLAVDDVCKVCRKCATTCPTNSIPFGGKVVHNGVEKYKINWESCYRLRPPMVTNWGSCLTCVTSCPYTKPDSWWKTLAIRALRRVPIPARPPIIRFLLWVNDRLWPDIERRRVRWLGYDSGTKPGEKACTVAGCTAAHADTTMPGSGKLGFYAPLKENTNRFRRAQQARHQTTT